MANKVHNGVPLLLNFARQSNEGKLSIITLASSSTGDAIFPESPDITSRASGSATNIPTLILVRTASPTKTPRAIANGRRGIASQRAQSATIASTKTHASACGWPGSFASASSELTLMIATSKLNRALRVRR